MATLYSVQYLRALAALAVVLFHAGERTGLHFTIGAAGVDVFFVLSGFIMMAISDSRPTGPLTFLRHRFTRIAPAYWAATLVMILAGAAGLFPNLKLDPVHVAGSFLFIPIPSPNSGNLWPVLVQGWTLNYEMFFYVAFAMILVLKPRLRMPALGLCFGLLVLAGLVLEPASKIGAFYTAPIILEFVAGAVLARLWRHGQLPSVATGLGLVGLALMGFATIQVFKMGFDAWSCGPLAVMLVSGAITIETRGRLPAVPLLSYLGDSSYSIYLWHTFAVSVVVLIGSKFGWPPVLTLGAATILGVTAGVLAYEGFEKPLNLVLRGKPVTVRPMFLRRRAAR
jgi:exopolysaccharide production protein ExoZ